MPGKRAVCILYTALVVTRMYSYDDALTNDRANRRYLGRSFDNMRNLKGNTHLSLISLYTKSTFPGLLLDRGSSCR